MNLPPKAVSEPVKDSTAASREMPSGATPVVGKPGDRRCSQRDEYVREDGIEKKIEGSLKEGLGHKLLISYLGNNNLTVYEKVAASTFGKGFGKTDNSRPDAKTITMGKAEELENKKMRKW